MSLQFNIFQICWEMYLETYTNKYNIIFIDVILYLKNTIN